MSRLIIYDAFIERMSDNPTPGAHHVIARVGRVESTGGHPPTPKCGPNPAFATMSRLLISGAESVCSIGRITRRPVLPM